MTTGGEAECRAPEIRTIVVVGLGNPGPEYDSTRHNVGWWVLDRFAYDHEFEPFARRAKRFEASRVVGGRTILLVKPRTYMNRSGLALTNLWRIDGFRVENDLLVVTDDANLDVGRVRFRPGGGAGGHNGLKSVSEVLGTTAYARLRVGVGIAPPGADLADWVLSPMPEEDEDRVVALLPELGEAIGVWADDGVEAAMNRFNR
ncbi:MAG: aminoacyl-tRNA hydrolase [Gemmatimonadetes bacterium]|nr:aminoacyl-tRNA hydrolase [Gemmatimonadota bacterium]MXX73698.1 aminoacyl-tRNA hydrolase [Gemmatimonadota bacterium]MYC92395.1 aminoacyl-tRNA hydrolase [Gemmatimonadota bacterium]MYG36024.1 aminoacyl-tRNA hydrolase [Gemmatimonadota bacterium]MYJ18581.1 aminoacyl-tRNA hydrolase [Gemmatimonadota bacterium]